MTATPGAVAGRPSDAYYAGARIDLLEFLASAPGRVLEVGCGAGGNAAWLRQHGATRLVGIDIDPESVATAARVLDLAIEGRVESVLPTVDESFDLIICADVLEHLVDPWSVLAQLRDRLAEGGVILASIPNIRQYRSLWRIAFGAGFAPEREGVFDATHLRFFTRRNIDDMFRASGLRPIRWSFSPPRRLKALRSALTRGLLGEYLAYQWYVIATGDRAESAWTTRTRSTDGRPPVRRPATPPE